MQYDIQKQIASRTQMGGFVLPFAVLVSSILLAIGLGIFSITMKELVISSSGRESQFAFYAADSAAECALYWDIRHTGFSTSVFATSSDSIVLPIGSSVACNSEDITLPATGWSTSIGWDVTDVSSTAATTIFDMAFSNGSCATVYVFKDSTLPSTTRIDAHGFNTCDATNSRRVERGLRIRY